MEIAIFGGTFDPPTVAHEAIIDACLEQNDIDEIWLMPSGVRTDKPGMRSDEIRIEMLDLIRQKYWLPTLKVSDFELTLPRPTKSCTTVRALEEAYPDNRFWFVYGADSYEMMHTWECGQELKKSLGMLLVARAGYHMPPKSATIRHLQVKNAEVNVSSTAVRELFRTAQPIDGLVSPQIGQFIVDHGLYEQVTIN